MANYFACFQKSLYLKSKYLQINNYVFTFASELWQNNAHTLRDAKGRKVSGNFGNFPWKVSGILKGWEFLEILGIFNCDLFSTFCEIICTKINRTEFSLHFIQTYLFCTTFLTVCWFVWVHRKNHKALLWNNIRSNLLSYHKIKYFMLFHIIFRISKETPDSKKKKNKSLILVDREYLGDSIVCRNPDKPVVNAVIKNTKLLYQNDSNPSVWMCSERSAISNKI